MWTMKKLFLTAIMLASGVIPALSGTPAPAEPDAETFASVERLKLLDRIIEILPGLPLEDSTGPHGYCYCMRGTAPGNPIPQSHYPSRSAMLVCQYFPGYNEDKSRLPLSSHCWCS
jgi:hypothetical protein